MNGLKKIQLYFKHLADYRKLDILSFKLLSVTETKIEEGIFTGHYTEIVINGKSIIDRLYDYELSEAIRTKTNKDLAGKYIGTNPQNIISKFKSGNSNNLSAWQCSICMSALCASKLICKYKVNALTVELYDFRQLSIPVPFNNETQHEETLDKSKWNYEAFGPFIFNRYSILKELYKLEKDFSRF